MLKEAFCGLPGTKLSKLKNLHSEVFTKIHWGRLMVFLNFSEQLVRTNEGGMGTTVCGATIQFGPSLSRIGRNTLNQQTRNPVTPSKRFAIEQANKH